MAVGGILSFFRAMSESGTAAAVSNSLWPKNPRRKPGIGIDQMDLALDFADWIYEREAKVSIPD